MPKRDEKGELPSEPRVGDWIRFYRVGELVIGQVEYIHTNWRGDVELMTDRGGVLNSGVLEYRRDP